MRLFQVARRSNILACRESGVTLLETAVALAMLGAIAVTFLIGLATTSKAVVVANEQTVAESLARSQMEWAKEVTYTVNATAYAPAPIPGEADYTGFSATITAEPLNTPDDGIQKVVVTVKHYDEELIILEGYKVNR